ncbi:MAG: response regulator transcription factor [Anaerovoracaceae bacterium]
MYNILICDDEKDIVNALKIYMANENYNLFEAFSGQEAIDMVNTERIDLVLMDVMMPGMDGIIATAHIRKNHNMPIIFLTAKGQDADKVLGLNMGGDDYVTKPFNPLEVLARVKSQLRRYAILGGMDGSNQGSSQVQGQSNEQGSSSQGSQNEPQDQVLSVGSIDLYDREKRVDVDGEPVNLTPTEFKILKLLMGNSGKVFSPKEIYEYVWDQSAFGDEGTVSVHIRHLREKVEINPKEPRYLKVVWGQGYKMEGKKNGK